ncbi:MAG: rhodanese-like domain-containing protein [Verrucomicrobiota bacterium]
MSSSPKSVDPARGGRRLAREAAFLFWCTLVPAALAGWLHPRSAFHAQATPRDVTKIELAAVQGWSQPVLWVDARPAPAFAAAHIPGAVNLTERAWEMQLGNVVGGWTPQTRIVVYCDGAGCQTSTAVAQRLKHDLQLDRIYVLTGGWTAWQATKR